MILVTVLQAFLNVQLALAEFGLKYFAFDLIKSSIFITCMLEFGICLERLVKKDVHFRHQLTLQASFHALEQKYDLEQHTQTQ